MHEKKKRGLKNIIWSLSDSFINLGIGLIISMLVVRYLGPEKNGTINYSAAYVALWSCLSDLGAFTIIQKEVVLKKYPLQELIGTGLCIGLIGGSFTFLGAISTVLLMHESGIVILCTGIIGITYVFKSAELFKYVKIANLESDKYVKNNIKLKIIISCYKLLLVFLNAGLIFFTLSYLFEAIIQVFFYYSVLNIEEKTGWIINRNLFIKILSQSWPYIILSVAVIIYMKIDQIMVGKMMGIEAVGIYSAAVTISELGLFIPSAISGSALTMLTDTFNTDKKSFEKEYISYFEKIILLMLSITIVTVLFAPIIVRVMYGEQYMEAVPIIKIYAFSAVFSAIGVADGAYINIYILQKKSMINTCMSSIVNILLNMLLIPRLGGQGAAIATVLTTFIQSMLIFLLWKETRTLVRYCIKAFRFFYTRNQLVRLLKRGKHR